MSADLLAEFGQGSAPAQSSSSEPQKTKQPQHSQINPLVDDFAQSDDIFFGGPSSSQPVQDHSLDSIPVSGHYKAQAPASRQQVPSLPAFNLPRQNNSDILFDAAEDTPASDTEDDWGDFEGPATNTIQPNQSEHSAPIAQDAPVSVQAPNPPNNQKATDTFNFFESLSIHGVTATAKTSPGSAEKNPSPQAINPSPNPNPTWDDDSFGDWGEFADAPSTTPNVPAPDSSPVSKIESASVRKSASNPKPPLKKKPTTARPAPQQPAWDDDAFDDWGDFNDGPDPTPAPTHTAQKSTSNSPSLGSFTSGNTTAPSTVRPTNIPPPSVLLELLVELMNNLQKEAAASSKTRQVPASQATTTPQNYPVHSLHQL